MEIPDDLEKFNSVHADELDRRYGAFVQDFWNTHLSSFYFDELRNRMVVHGKVPEKIFEAYLTLKNITWGDTVPASELRKVLRNEALNKKYPPAPSN